MTRAEVKTRMVGDQKMVSQNILINPDLRLRIKAYASANGIKLFKVFELALTEYLDNQENQK